MQVRRLDNEYMGPKTGRSKLGVVMDKMYIEKYKLEVPRSYKIWTPKLDAENLEL